ncbi:hypothetical protein [Streptomyces sp. MP131-18]|uniref:hypothetical protein n=1 Tax=Streptomyces sp. MP131-18 TaxID=1857892 RepID=UPI00097C72CB|nr:hypothetical protein [Streptomyces sp. MP131-18]ONK13096.1 hypothetical protein STBA_38580 [Streptomyces sp. MP131-18]
MGTRGFITLAVDGENKTTYNQWDSYPEGLGLTVVSWAREAAKDLDAVRKAVTALRVVTEDDSPTDEDIERLRRFADFEVDRSAWNGETYVPRERPSWYQLLRRTQGDPAAMIRAGVIESADEFPADSLFAEWGYVVDLTAETFEVYQGFQTRRHRQGRFADMTPERDGYYPVRLVKSWLLAELPGDKDFAAEAECAGEVY